MILLRFSTYIGHVQGGG